MTVIKCISPVDGSVYAERESMPLAAAQEAVARAKKAQKAWAKRPLEDRIQLVLKGVARVNEMADEIVPEIAWQMGRPVRYGGEFKGFNERSNYVAEIAGSSLAPIVIEDSASFERRIEREPHGVVFVIAPWNYPYMTAINTIAPALMAGNVVIIKHAAQTLLVGERLVRAFTEAGAMAKWLPPHGFTCQVHHLEARVGGSFRMSFHNFGSGQSHAFGGEYLELVPGERIVMSFGWADGAMDVRDHTVTVTFGRLAGGRTLFSFHQTSFATVEARDSHIGGWSSLLDKLVAYLATEDAQ